MYIPGKRLKPQFYYNYLYGKLYIYVKWVLKFHNCAVLQNCVHTMNESINEFDGIEMKEMCTEDNIETRESLRGTYTPKLEALEWQSYEYHMIKDSQSSSKSSLVSNNSN